MKMTKKRYKILDGSKLGTYSEIWDNQKQNNERIGDELWLGEVVDRLNKQDMMIKSQEKQLQKQHKIIVEQDNRIEMLEDEIEQHKAVINKEWNEYLKKKGLL